MLPMNWVEKYQWAATYHSNIWLNVDTCKYHYSDEAALIDEIGYDNFVEAEKSLNLYCEYLNTMNAVTKHF